MKVFNRDGSEVTDLQITNNITAATGKFTSILIKNQDTGQYAEVTLNGAPPVQQLNVSPTETP